MGSLKKSVRFCLDRFWPGSVQLLNEIRGSYRRYRRFSKTRIRNTKEYWERQWSSIGAEARGEGFALHEELVKLVPNNVNVLDIGSGNGGLLRLISKRKHNVKCTGLDFSTTAVSMLQAFGIEGICSVLPRIPVSDESFDVVICSETFEHLDNPDYPKATLEEMVRVAKSAGLIIISVPDGSRWRRAGDHVNEFNPTDCSELLRPHTGTVNLKVMEEPYIICCGTKK